MDNDMTDKNAGNEGWGGLKITVLIVVVLVVCGGAVWGAIQLLGGGKSNQAESIPTYTAQRGDLNITISAGGTIQALTTTQVESEVEGQNKILEIVPEGTVLTKEDVKNGKVIVRLDSSSMEDNVEQQKITVQNAEASYTSAEESYKIQKQTNEGNISQAKLDVRFALMDLQKYLGKELAAKVVDEEIDFTRISEHEQLGGEALVKKNNLEAAISLAEEQLTRSEDTLSWTEKLVEKGYVNRNEQVADKLQVQSRQQDLNEAESNLFLFKEYTLPKQAEQLASDYEDAQRELKRVEARARSQLAQAEADLRSKESTYELKKERLEKMQTMIENSTIEAPKPGLVVYASTINPRRYRNDPIEEGTNIREGQTIISIPDLDTLAAQVEIHETDIQSVEEGQKAVLTVEAMPDKSWEGEVVRVSPMASSEHRFLNPDVMVYETNVAFSGTPKGLKPGMSSTAEITVANLSDVVSVPVQAVTTYEGQRVVWVKNSEKLRLKQVETGQFSDTEVEIKNGLEEGEEVLLASPEVKPADVEVVTLPGGGTKVAEADPEKEEASGPGGPDGDRQRGQGGPPGQGQGGGRRGPGGGRPQGGPGGGGQEGQGRDQNGQEGQQGRRRPNPAEMDVDKFVSRLKEMPAEQRKKILSRIRGRLDSMPEEAKKKMQQALDRLEQQSGN